MVNNFHPTDFSTIRIAFPRFTLKSRTLYVFRKKEKKKMNIEIFITRNCSFWTLFESREKNASSISCVYFFHVNIISIVSRYHAQRRLYYCDVPFKNFRARKKKKKKFHPRNNSTISFNRPFQPRYDCNRATYFHGTFSPRREFLPARLSSRSRNSMPRIPCVRV